VNGAPYQPELIITRPAPVIGHSKDGVWQISISAMQRHGEHDTDGWLLHWAGTDAYRWWADHADALVPGRMLRVSIARIRAHTDGKFGSARIHARCALLELLPARWPARANEAKAAA
jgi:hypothetical protein